MTTLEKPMGGTEILANKVKSLLGSQLDDFNILVTKCYPKDLKDDKINVLWQHNNIDDHNMVKMMNYRPMVEKIDHFIFVSNYQYEVFKSHFDIPAHRCHVIRNATDKVEVTEKPKDKIRLLYASTPWRGLGILLQSFELLDRNDIELEVYSGISIYGKEYLPNAELKERMKQCHIMAYPSAFPETSCLAAIEAMAAGCKFVGSSFAALPETCGVFGTLIPIEKITSNTKHMNDFVQRYAEALDDTIENYWSDETQSLLQDQVKHYNIYYTWDYVKKDWEKFIQQAKILGKI
jgi:glycosyltransferase involved in cell wall biosynthesis